MPEAEIRAAVCAEVVRILSEARRTKGLSMNALAKKAGLSQPMISILESSQPNPKLDTLLRISTVLELNLGIVVQQALANVSAEAESGKRLSNRG